MKNEKSADQATIAAQATQALVPEPKLHWQEGDVSRCASWRSEAGLAPPKRVQIADDTLNADAAWRLACEGTALLWRGDFQNARQLLQAMARRIDRAPRKAAKKHGAAGAKPEGEQPSAAFHQHRMQQAQRARVLGMLLIPFDADYAIPLRRAPDARPACLEAWGEKREAGASSVASLRELLGLIGAHEWRKKGVDIPALGARIHPHYGVFSPVRGEYVALVANTNLPAVLSENSLAFDIGTGTGVLAAVLARRGVQRVIATEANELMRDIELQVAAGPEPTRRLASDWRERAEDAIWALVNSPEFQFVP